MEAVIVFSAHAGWGGVVEAVIVFSARAGWEAEVGMLDIDLIPDLRSKGVKGRTLGIDTCK